MAKKKISQLVAVSSLDGNEPVALVQSGVTKKATINQIVSFIGGTYINGSGTAGKLAKFTDGDTIGDSIVSESGGVATIAGTLNISTGAPNIQLTDTTNGIVHYVEGTDTSLVLYSDFGNTQAGSSIDFRVDGNTTRMSLSATQLITFSASNTGENHIFGGTTRMNGLTRVIGSEFFVAGSTTEGSGYQLNAITMGYNLAGSYGWITAGGASSRTDLHLNLGGGSVHTGSTLNVGGNLNVGASLGSDRRFSLRGQGTTSSTYTAEFANASGSTILLLRDDGVAYIDDRLVINSFVDNGSDKLQVNGSATFSSSVAIASDLIVDTNTLYVDATNNKVGIGMTPYTKFDVNGPINTGATAGYTLGATALLPNSAGGFYHTDGATTGYVNLYANLGGLRFGVEGNSNVLDFVKTTGAATFSSSVQSTELKTNAPTSGTAVFWKLGSVVSSGGQSLDNTRYVEVEIDGTFYKLALLN